MRMFVPAILVAGALGGKLWAEELDAYGILSQTAKVYREAQDFAASVRGVVHVKMFGAATRQTVRQSVVYQRPNRLWLESTMGPGRATRTVICDGSHVYVRQDWANEYSKHEAPQSLMEIIEIQGDALEYLKTMVDVPIMLDGADLNDRIKEARLERAGTYRRAAVYVVNLRLNDGSTERLWIDRNSFLIHKLEFRTSPQQLLGKTSETAREEMTPSEGQTPAGEAELRELGEALLAFMQQLGSPEMTWTARYSGIRLNSGVSNDQFRFHLRPGEKRVRKLSSLPMSEADVTSLELEEGPAADLTGRAAPDFELPNLQGERVKLSQFQGRPVLLYFWESRCGPCIAQLPEVEALHRELGDKGLQVVGVNLDGSLEEAQESAGKAGITFTTLWLDPANPQSLSVDAAYGLQVVPRVLVFDGAGMVVADLTGYHDPAAIMEALKKAGL